MAGTGLRLWSHPMTPSREVELDLDPTDTRFQKGRPISRNSTPSPPSRQP